VTYVVILIVVALLGNFLLRRLIKRVDKEPVAPSGAGAVSVEPSSIQPNEVLQAWATRATAPAQIAGPVHPRILEILEQYQSIGPDKYFTPIDRQYAGVPFSENDAFVQIGAWGDGSEVLAKRDSSDGRIYLAEIEDADPEHPVTFASTIEEFLTKAWDYHQDSPR
jgi:hypothetical protein